MSKGESKGLAAVLLGASILGFAAIFVRWSVTGGATALTTGFYRMLFALPGAWLMARNSGDVAGDPYGRRWALIAGVLFFGDLWLWHLAMHHTGAANATLLVGGLSPIWVALFSFAFLRLRYSWLGWAGQAVGLGGALVLALAKGARMGDGKGEAIAVAASVCYAAFTLAMGRARQHFQATQTLFWMSLSCMACFGLVALAEGHAFSGYSPAAWWSLLGLGLVVQVGAWGLNTWGLGHVDPALGAIGLQGQQVATIFLAWGLLHEPLRPLGFLGGAAIVAGIIMVATSPKRLAA
ncbi:MAG TPA: DMT family transporter [Holophagaceae bacterium]|nr:DMT family transporter [Holophagaceae bacterium]